MTGMLKAGAQDVPANERDKYTAERLRKLADQVEEGLVSGLAMVADGKEGEVPALLVYAGSVETLFGLIGRLAVASDAISEDIRACIKDAMAEAGESEEPDIQAFLEAIKGAIN